MNNYKIFILLFTLYSLLFTLFCGCARKGKPVIPPLPKKIYIKVTLEITGKIDPQEVIYIIAFDIDGDTVDGPLANKLIREEVPRIIAVELKGTGFWLYKGDISGAETREPFSTYRIIDNKIEIEIPHEKLENVNLLAINCITYDKENKVVDAIGSMETDTNVVYFNIGERQKSFNDTFDDEELKEEKASFNIKCGKVEVIEK